MPSHRFHAISPPEAIATLARRGSHVGVLTRSSVEPDLATGTLVELPITDLPSWHVTLALAYRAKDADARHVRAVRATLTRR